jgi:hypothetical protein
MAVITVTGTPGCRVEEAARAIARRLGYELVSESRLRQHVAETYGSETAVPDALFPHVLAHSLAALATRHHLVAVWPGAESAAAGFPGLLRVGVAAGVRYRVGTLMVDHQLERGPAAQLLRHLEREQESLRRRQFRRGRTRPEEFDLACNAETMDSAEIADLVERAVEVRGLTRLGLPGPEFLAGVEFRARMALSRHGIAPPAAAPAERRPFANRSEEIFGNLLDFYRIAWEYEPREFALRWDSDGRVVESFTPDFYLPEFDLYVELTTMRQSLVTRKNRKLRLLRSLYPKVNIQIFYQRDFQNLVFKLGLPAQPAPAGA